MTFLSKIKWILGISLVFLLILATNLIDRQNFIIVRDSVETIYADRLWAKKVIYDMTKQLGQKEVAYVKYESNEQVGDIAINNQQLAEQIELFADTRLTALEESTFSRLKKDLQNLAKIEVEVAAGRAPVTGLFTGLASVRDGIDQLVEIQMREGRRELSISNKAIGSITLFGQIEIISLIIMAILIQIIILYTPKADTDT